MVVYMGKRIARCEGAAAMITDPGAKSVSKEVIKFLTEIQQAIEDGKHNE